MKQQGNVQPACLNRMRPLETKVVLHHRLCGTQLERPVYPVGQDLFGTRPWRPAHWLPLTQTAPTTRNTMPLWAHAWSACPTRGSTTSPRNVRLSADRGKLSIRTWRCALALSLDAPSAWSSTRASSGVSALRESTSSTTTTPGNAAKHAPREKSTSTWMGSATPSDPPWLIFYDIFSYTSSDIFPSFWDELWTVSEHKPVIFSKNYRIGLSWRTRFIYPCVYASINELMNLWRVTIEFIFHIDNTSYYFSSTKCCRAMLSSHWERCRNKSCLQLTGILICEGKAVGQRIQTFKHNFHCYD